MGGECTHRLFIFGEVEFKPICAPARKRIMVLKRVSFILTLINAIFARPEKPIQAFVTPCNVWALHGEYVKDYSESIQTNFFNYS